MKHEERVRSVSHQILAYSDELNTINEPLSENQILDLQEKFLTNGFHLIKVPSIKVGRILMYKFLASLPFYHEVGCITDYSVPLKHTIADIRQELIAGGYLDPLSPNYLDEYFIEYFYYDFIWIEATRALINSESFKDIERKLIDFNINQQIPIIVVVT